MSGTREGEIKTAKEKYSLLEIMVKRGISRRMYRNLSREINDRKQAKLKHQQELLEANGEIK